MSRTVPAGLQGHLDQAATTTTRLIKFTLKSGFSYGFAMLDASVEYDDGGGPIVYSALNGFDASTFAADLGFSVANAEGRVLLSSDVEGITEEMVNAGELDDAQWICYLVNFEDLSQGHTVIDAGDVGEVKMKHGVVWMPELLSYIMRLRQTVGGVWSRKCRAIFGTPANSQTGCGVDLAPLWLSGEVTALGLEVDRLFTGDEAGADSPNQPVPGVLQWLTGANAGKSFSVEGVDGLAIELQEPTPYPIVIGDTYRIRPDCAKRYLQDCVGRYDNGVNFKGEPDIPVGDANAVQMPGAQRGLGGGFTGGGE